MYRFFSWRGLPGKLVLSALLSLLAVGLLLLRPSAERLFCAAAMLLSSLGDGVMAASNRGGDRRKRRFALGAALFGIAHLCYCRAYLLAVKQAEVAFPNPGACGGIILFGAGLACLLLFWRAGRTTLPYLLGATVYLGLICLSCTVIFTYALGAGGARLLAGVGALSFFVSDFLIGLRVFGGVNSPAAAEAVWWFYPIGQLLLVVFL